VFRRHNSDSFLVDDKCESRGIVSQEYEILITLVVLRADEKTAKDFNITAGSVLHLVLALRGGVMA
jgi:ubiquitin-like protein Nedd8